jgi:hypothetical protein
MPELKRTWRWETYLPDLGENRECDRPFFVKVKTGLTKEELREWAEKWAALDPETATVDAVHDILAGAVEMGEEPLAIQGKPIAGLREYCHAVAEVAGLAHLHELAEAVQWCNSVHGARALFYGRLSGGIASMASHRASRAAAH